VTGTTISTTWANNTLSDIASALTASIAKDGQTTPTANLPMGGYVLTGLGNGTANGHSVRFEQVLDPAGGNALSYMPDGTGAVETTVQSKLRETVSVEDFGAVGDGSTDDYAAIQAAIDAVSAAGGGEVLFAAKEYAIETKLLVQTDGVRLVGKGSGSTRAGTIDEDSSATLLTWTGATLTGPMVEFSSAGTYQLVGAGIIGIGLNCDNAKATGLLMTACFKCVVDDVSVFTSTGDAVQFDVQTLVSDPGANQSLWVNRLSVVNNESGTGDGVVLKGTAVANTNLSLFGELDLLMYDGDGLVLENADGNVFQQVHCYRHPSGTGVGVRFKAGATSAEVARYNTILWAQCDNGGLVAEGTASGTVSSKHNRVVCYSFGNASPTPTIEAGASFSYGSDIGTVRHERDGGVPTITLNRADGNAATEILGKIEAAGYDDAGNATTYASMDCIINDATNTSEDASWRIATLVAGANTVVAQFGNGWVVGSPTGGFKGNGTINCAGDIYKNNTAFTNPDYVFEHYYTGQIVKFADNPGASTYNGKLSIEDIEQIAKETHRLPGFNDLPTGAFERFDMLLEKLEEAYLCIFELNKRVKELEQ